MTLLSFIGSGVLVAVLASSSEEAGGREPPLV